MAYGDSFGGVQAAQQNQQRARAADYFNSVAATRAQQAQDAAIAQANRSYMLQQQALEAAAQERNLARQDRQQELGVRNDQFALDYMTRRGDVDFQRDLQLENRDMNRARFDWDKELQAQKLLTGVDEVTHKGAALAADLGDATEKRKEALARTAGIESYMAELNNILKNPSEAAKANSNWKGRVEGKIKQTADDLIAAKRDLSNSDYLFKKATSQAMNLGFIPQNGKLVHGRTGKAFDYMMAPSMTAALTPNVAPNYNPSYQGSEEQYVSQLPAVAPRRESPAFYLRGRDTGIPVPPSPSPAFRAVTQMPVAPQIDVSETVIEQPTRRGFGIEDQVNVDIQSARGIQQRYGDTLATQYLAQRGIDPSVIIAPPNSTQSDPSLPYLNRRNEAMLQPPTNAAPVRAAAPVRLPLAPPQRERTVGAVYQTPRGPARWMGTGWQLAQ